MVKNWDVKQKPWHLWKQTDEQLLSSQGPVRALPPWLLEHMQSQWPTNKKGVTELLTHDLCKNGNVANVVAACVWTRYCDYLRYSCTSEHEGVLVSPLDRYLLSDPLKPFKPYDKISECMVAILSGWGPVDGGEGWWVVGCS